MRLELEKYNGTKSRHTCPSCDCKKSFVRYVDEKGEYLSSEVGRCNRESKCGYHYKPKQFFPDNPSANTEHFMLYGNIANKNNSRSQNGSRVLINKPDYIPFESFKFTLADYQRNAFVRFLLSLFPDCADEVQDVLKMYFVGTCEDYTCFPSIDQSNRICKAKLIRFNPATGKRLKGEFDTSSLVAKLKKQGKIKAEFNYKQIFFGEHLLPINPNKPIAIVEAEKTAIIASLCFPEFVWLGSNSKTWLKVERLQRLKNRQIILYPDADGFDLWQGIATDAQRQGLTVKVSSLIENHATDEQKESGYDLADYLIEQQKEINQTNDFVDRYNAKLKVVLNDEK